MDLALEAGQNIIINWIQPPPPPDPLRKKYPYLKRPAHLTNGEFERINDVCRGFKSIDHLSERQDKIKDKIAKKREELLELTKSSGPLEVTLEKYEKFAIRCTRNLAKRKKLEGECKKIREMIIEKKKRAAALERDVIDLEESDAELERATQTGAIVNARSLFVLCDRVRRRREIEKQTRALESRDRSTDDDGDDDHDDENNLEDILGGV